MTDIQELRELIKEKEKVDKIIDRTERLFTEGRYNKIILKVILNIEPGIVSDACVVAWEKVKRDFEVCVIAELNYKSQSLHEKISRMAEQYARQQVELHGDDWSE